jgi:hypothetical protein
MPNKTKQFILPSAIEGRVLAFEATPHEEASIIVELVRSYIPRILDKEA